MKRHYLKTRSSFIVVFLRSLQHKGCVCCGKPLKSLEESEKHWEEELKKSGYFGNLETDKTQLRLFSKKEWG